MPGRPLALALVLTAATFAVPTASAEPVCDVSGVWRDDFGTLYLRMSSSGSVSGDYTWQNGTISGIMDGIYVNGSWREEPTFAGPRDAGTFSWTVGEDCSAFDGTYAYAEDPEGVAGSWSARRVESADGPDVDLPLFPLCDPRGEWQTNHGRVYLFTEGTLAQLQGNWLRVETEPTRALAGAFTGRRFQGAWTQAGESAHFVMVFDDTCDTFRGDWTGDALIHQWEGSRMELAPAPVTPVAPTPDACDPRGSWIATHGRIDIDKADPLHDLRAQWQDGSAWKTMRGAFEGLAYEGSWWTEEDPTPRPFVMIFEADCASFQGQWTDGMQTRAWTGYRAAASATPDEPQVTPSPSEEHIPGLGADEDDPLGIAGPSIAFVALACLVAALLASSFRARRR